MKNDVSKFGLRLKRLFSFGEGDMERYPGELGKSLTVQGDSYTIRELFQRANAGLLVPDSGPVFSGEDADFDDVDREKFLQLDLYDRQDLVREYGARIRALVDARKKEAADKVAALNTAKSVREGEEPEKPVQGVSASSRYEKSSTSKKLEGKSSPRKEE